MSLQFKPPLYLFLLGLHCLSALAQQPQASQATVNRQQARRSLAQLRETLPELENECAKIAAQAELAKLRWGQDEAQARELLEAAFKASFKAQPEAEKCPAQKRIELGLQILEFIAKHDAEWAVQLVEALPTASPRDLKTNLYLQLAVWLQGAEKAQSALQTVLNKLPDAAGANLLRETFANANAAPDEGQIEQDLAPDAGNFAALNLFNFSATTDPQSEAARAWLSGDFQQTLSLSEKISHPQMRLQFDSMARFGAVAAASAEGNYAEALQQAQALSEPSQRATAFINLAQAVRSQKGAVRAAEILSLAQQSIEAEKESRAKARALLALAEAVIELETERGFELAQAALDTLNAAIGGDKPATGETDYEEPAFGQVLTRLARYDFARVWQLTLGIKRRELAWFTQLAVCQGMIEEEAPAVAPKVN